jgi:hypothetical protein
MAPIEVAEQRHAELNTMSTPCHLIGQEDSPRQPSNRGSSRSEPRRWRRLT